MRCANHSIFHPAVQCCSNCGKGLCQPCANAWESHLCTSCALERFSRQKQHSTRLLISLTLAFFLGGYFFTHGSPYGQVEKESGAYFIIMGAISGGAIAGWKYLKLRQDNSSRIVWHSPKWYGMFMILRMLMSVFIGTLMLPYAIYSAIDELLKSSKGITAIRAAQQEMSI